MTLSLSQRLAVSALVEIAENLVPRIPEPEAAQHLREVIAAVRAAFTPPRAPTLIISDPDFEEDFFQPEAVGSSA